MKEIPIQTNDKTEVTGDTTIDIQSNNDQTIRQNNLKREVKFIEV